MSVTAGDGGGVDQLPQSHQFTMNSNCEDDEDEDDLFHEQVIHSVGPTKSPTVSWTYNPPPWYQLRPTKPLFFHSVSPTAAPPPIAHDDHNTDAEELNEALPGLKAALDSVSLYEACALVDPVLHTVAKLRSKRSLHDSVSTADVAQTREAWKAFATALLTPCTECAEPSSSRGSVVSIAKILDTPVCHQGGIPHPDSCASCTASSDCHSPELSPECDQEQECDVASRSFSSASSGFSLHRSASSSRSSSAVGDGVDDVEFDSPPIRDRPPLFSHPTESIHTPPTTPPSSSPELSSISPSSSRKATTFSGDEPSSTSPIDSVSVTRHKYRYPQPQPPSRDEVLQGMVDFHKKYAQKMQPLKARPPKPDLIPLGPGLGVDRPSGPGSKSKTKRVSSVTIKTADGVLLGEVGGDAVRVDPRFWERAKAIRVPGALAQGLGAATAGGSKKASASAKDTPLSGGVLFTPLNPASAPSAPVSIRSKHKHLKTEVDSISLPNTPGPSPHSDANPAGTGGGGSKAHHTRQRSLTTLRSALLVRKSRSVEGSPRSSPRSLADSLPGDHRDHLLASESDGDPAARGEKPRRAVDESETSESCDQDKDSDSQAELEADSDGWIRIKSPLVSTGKRRRRREAKRAGSAESDGSRSVDMKATQKSKSTKEKETIFWPSLNDPPVFPSIRDSTPSPGLQSTSTTGSSTKHKKSSPSLPHFPASHPTSSLSPPSKRHSRSSSHSPPSNSNTPSPPFKVVPRPHQPPSSTSSSISSLPPPTGTPALPMAPAAPPVLGPGGSSMMYHAPHPPPSVNLPMYPVTAPAVHPYAAPTMWMPPPGLRQANINVPMGVGVQSTYGAAMPVGHAAHGALPAPGYAHGHGHGHGMGNMGMGYPHGHGHGHVQPTNHGGWWV